MVEFPALLVLDLLGTFAFAVNGALTAIRTVRVDIVGVLTLGMVTAVGGGIIRDVLLGAVPRRAFVDWRHLMVAAAGGLIAFLFGRGLDRVGRVIDVLDAAALSLFAVTGAVKALGLGVGPAQAVILGAVTAVGGGTMRDVLIRQVPGVLSSGLYAIPALVGAALVVIAVSAGVEQRLWAPVAVGAAAVCFAIRMLGLHFGLDAPGPRGAPRGRRPPPASTVTTMSRTVEEHHFSTAHHGEVRAVMKARAACVPVISPVGRHRS